MHPPVDLAHRSAPASQLRPGSPAAPRTNYLPLLPSGPDGVHSILPRRTQSSTPLNEDGSRQAQGLGRGFSPAIADCGYRAPLAPRLARPDLILSYRYFIVKHDTRHCVAMRCRCGTKIAIDLHCESAKVTRQSHHYNYFLPCRRTFHQAYP